MQVARYLTKTTNTAHTMRQLLITLYFLSLKAHPLWCQTLFVTHEHEVDSNFLHHAVELINLPMEGFKKNIQIYATNSAPSTLRSLKKLALQKKILFFEEDKPYPQLSHPRFKESAHSYLPWWKHINLEDKQRLEGQ